MRHGPPRRSALTTASSSRCVHRSGHSSAGPSRSSDGSRSAPSQRARAMSLSAPARPRYGGSGAGACGSAGCARTIVGARRARCQWWLCCSVVDGEGRTQAQQARRAGASLKGCSERRRSATRRAIICLPTRGSDAAARRERQEGALVKRGAFQRTHPELTSGYGPARRLRWLHALINTPRRTPGPRVSQVRRLYIIVCGL